MKKFFFSVAIVAAAIILFGIAAPVSHGLVFDLREGKTPSSPNELFFDNLPHIASSAYSGIFAGDSVLCPTS